ncbi:chloramphenicol phosphotransferase [Thalassobaculum sp. OXR-137]|uniref:chloramphenicol phosphotransferase CPT family protein n=1 Tax=Thalassobaculum sp. OXR-137 TaxID=3100173 RepID=UPI002AC9D9A6|nr:AAA family ATPase [Thalassobaculum sp. OXR-137]WPZ32520.1 chloramphenicol phosphotransferase [Thalassobaculum sp. OXR-137]
MTIQRQDMTATVILLNGVGSAGKSSLSRAFQAIAREPFLHVQMDAFFDMLPSGLIGHPDGVQFIPLESDGPPEVAVRSGPVAAKLFDAIPVAVAALAAAGNNVIVDDVILRDGMAEYRRALAPFRFLTVGVHAPLEVLEAREAARGDRRLGLARWQYPRVHAGRSYDLEIYTGSLSPEAAAATIRDAFDL